MLIVRVRFLWAANTCDGADMHLGAYDEFAPRLPFAHMPTR